MKYPRRVFIKRLAATAAAFSFSNSLMATGGLSQGSKNYSISFFTKPLDEYDPEFMIETLAMSGIDGLDLSVRPKGRVEPFRVVDNLPGIIESGKKFKLQTEMMVTTITDASAPMSKTVLQTAAQLGIKHYRLGYYDYDFKMAIQGTLNEIRKKLSSLAVLNEEIGIQAGFHNHSGTRVGAPMWDVWELVKDFPVELISSQFDVRHAVSEGNASWIIALQLLSKHIGSLAIKDFTWEIRNRKAKVISTPLGEGIVDFDLFFRTIKELKITAPITLHIEYPFLAAGEESLSLLGKQKIIVSKIKKDTDFIRLKLNQHQLI